MNETHDIKLTPREIIALLSVNKIALSEAKGDGIGSMIGAVMISQLVPEINSAISKLKTAIPEGHPDLMVLAAQASQIMKKVAVDVDITISSDK